VLGALRGYATLRSIQLDFIANRIMDILPISGWQVEQKQDVRLVLLIMGARDGLNDETLLDQLINSLAQENAVVPYFQLHRVAEVPKNASGKTPLVKAYQLN
jgi:hypothetical protein